MTPALLRWGRTTLAVLLTGLLLTMSTDANPASDPAQRLLLTDFTSSSPDLGWFVVNDNVMGGRSEGDFVRKGPHLHFTGRTNTNGGGFSSIRTRTLALDLRGYDGIAVRVKGDGRTYTWRLSTDARYRGRSVSYWATFPTTKDTWVEARVPFQRFTPRFRGSDLPGPTLDPSAIRGMGLMIYDKVDGAFAIEVDHVHAYMDRAPITAASWRRTKRVLLVFAPTAADARVARQAAAVEATRKAFDERDLLLVVVATEGPSRANGHALTQAEASALRKGLEIGADTFAVVLLGKDGSAKQRAAEPLPMQELYDLIDSMPMRQREMRGRDGGR